jgi:hypothetical protein
MVGCFGISRLQLLVIPFLGSGVVQGVQLYVWCVLQNLQGRIVWAHPADPYSITSSNITRHLHQSRLIGDSSCTAEDVYDAKDCLSEEIETGKGCV